MNKHASRLTMLLIPPTVHHGRCHPHHMPDQWGCLLLDCEPSKRKPLSGVCDREERLTRFQKSGSYSCTGEALYRSRNSVKESKVLGEGSPFLGFNRVWAPLCGAEPGCA